MFKMHHSLSQRQKECLAFIKDYFYKHDCSPRLKEIADNLKIKPPTAHSILVALQNKGYLYFGRSKLTGFFIRLVEDPLPSVFN
jgi:Mn-dependent DtxR family transcriptional regulator